VAVESERGERHGRDIERVGRRSQAELGLERRVALRRRFAVGRLQVGRLAVELFALGLGQLALQRFEVGRLPQRQLALVEPVLVQPQHQPVQVQLG
jgi:hypothetical protein